VIPITVSNAPMVTASDLPASLRQLAFQNGLPVRPDPDFHNDMNRLIAALERACPARTRRPAREPSAGGRVGLVPVILAVVGILVLGTVIALPLLLKTRPGLPRVAPDQLTNPGVSPEMEIQRLKGEIANLDGDIKRSFSKLAEAEIDLEKLKNSKPAGDALLEAKQEAVRLARKDLDAMQSQRDQLKTRVAEIETRLEEVRLEQTQGPVQVDDGKLEDVKKGLEDIRKDIERTKKDAELRRDK
jgi:hypothetical protein